MDLLVHPLQAVRGSDSPPVRLREVETAQRLLPLGQQPLRQLPEILRLEPGRRLLQTLSGFIVIGALVPHPPQPPVQLLLERLRRLLQGVLQKMPLAALPGHSRQVLAPGVGQSGVGVGDHQPKAPQAPLLQPRHKLRPGELRLPVDHLDPHHLAVTLCIHPDRHQHRRVHDPALPPHLLVAGVQDQIGKLALQRPQTPRLQLLVQPPRIPAHRLRTQPLPEQLLADPPHLTGRDPLHVALRQGRDQRPLAPLIALQHRGIEPAVPRLRHPQLQRPHPRPQPPRLEAVALRPPNPASLEGRRAHVRIALRVHQPLKPEP